MKKRNIAAILAALALVLTLFAACGDNSNETDEPSTVIGADGQVYKEVTEIVSEIVSEIVTVEKTEVVTDKQGEKVTDSNGEVKTEKVTNSKGDAEIVTEVVTEIVTSVESVTVPYEPETETENKTPETTTAAAGNDSTEASTESEFGEYEEETLPEGDLISVEMGSDGQPKEPLMKKYMDASSQSRQFYIDCVIVTNETLGYESGVRYKLFLKDNNMAIEMKLGLTSIRMATYKGGLNIVFPAAKAYYSIASTEAPDIGNVDLGLWDSIGSATMDYVSTSRVKLKKNNYTCEEYTDGTNTNKYYFDSAKNLKRIEIITSDGGTTILNVKDCSAKVDDSVFQIPKGYTAITEDQLQSLMGAFA